MEIFHFVICKMCMMLNDVGVQLCTRRIVLLIVNCALLFQPLGVQMCRRLHFFTI